MLDLDALKAGVDLVEIASNDTTLKQSGAWWVGPCPICGGRDRFNVQAGRWFCRGCERAGRMTGYGDALLYVALRDGLDLRKRADLERAAGALGGATASPVAERPKRKQRAPAPYTPPPADWQAAARRLVESSAAALWAESGRRALDWLRARGLTDSTISAARLGWNARAMFDAREAWGLPAELDSKTGKPRRVHIPRGIIMPCDIGGAIWYLKVRRLPDDHITCLSCRHERTGPGECPNCGADLPKYLCVTGSKPAALYGAETLGKHAAAVLVEGELDALLLRQEAGDLVDVATLGAANNSLNTPEHRAALLGLNRVLVAFDHDKAGRAGAKRLVADLGRRARRVRTPTQRAGDKDATDFYTGGGRLRDWVAYELAWPSLGLARSGAPITTEPAAAPLAPVARRPAHTIRWAPGACPAVIGGHWHREPNGAVVARYDDDYELALALVFAPEDQLSTELAAAFLQAACGTE